MNRDKIFVFGLVIVIILVVAIAGAVGRSGATTGKTSNKDAAQGTGGFSSAVLTSSNGRPIPVSQQGISSIAGSVGISNTNANPVPVSVQGQINGIVSLTNSTSGIPVPVSVQNTATVQLDQDSKSSLNALNKLSFDGSGNLKTTSGGGGTSGSVASKGFTFFDGLKGNQDKMYDVTINGITSTINVSLVTVKAPEVVDIEFLGPGVEFDVSGSARGTNEVFALPQRVPINRFHVSCVGLNGCIFKINLVGD
jgi:hypothetical protein